ncbi:hypothetical protein [Clostridium estertheticum]|uniref:hypothetical protein n=1 Tax=Clostridium estertheticum TaxID=238834 RepID=UPI001CF4B68E|nr:hypothetical protein [Clostridium estertheticum]MCB2360239.1 hypothetical protein [Clostridium estertheticum]
MLSKKVILITSSIIFIITFSAFSLNTDTNRQVLDDGGKKITLLKHDNISTYNELALKKINLINDVRAFDWIDDDTILISKENKNYPKLSTPSGMIYPQNLYLHNLKTNENKLIIGSKLSMSNAILSQDKKHVFYKEGIENLTGFILDLKTKQKIQVTKKDSIYPTQGQWINNDNVIFSLLPEGKIYSASVKGKLSLLTNVKGISSTTIKIKNDLYYVVGEKLYKQELNSSNRKLLRKDLTWLIPSPNQSQFALVKHTSKKTRTLILSDLMGNELKTFAEGTQIMGTSWSSDGSKLAYTVASENNCDAGLFVADAKNNKVVQLAVDIQYISDSVKWSPSGKRLLASNIMLNNNNSFTTYIIDLK